MSSQHRNKVHRLFSGLFTANALSETWNLRSHFRGWQVASSNNSLLFLSGLLGLKLANMICNAMIIVISWSTALCTRAKWKQNSPRKSTLPSHMKMFGMDFALTWSVYCCQSILQCALEDNNKRNTLSSVFSSSISAGFLHLNLVY